ncbi:MAG: PEP-CTERM sorting domain-containing protein [Akkermansiaceae bacterium]
MRIRKLGLIPIIAASLSISQNSEAAVQIDYALGGGSFFTKSGNTFFSAGDAFVFYGSFETGDIPTGSSTSQSIEDDFIQLGLPLNDPYSGGAFSSSDNETQLASKQGYMIVTNNADIGSSTQISIITNSTNPDWQFAADLSGAIPPASPTVSSDGAFSTGGQIVLGTAGTSGGFDTIQFAAIAVPEPSGTALLAIGSAFLLLRRKK